MSASMTPNLDVRMAEDTSVRGHKMCFANTVDVPLENTVSMIFLILERLITYASPQCAGSACVATSAQLNTPAGIPIT